MTDPGIKRTAFRPAAFAAALLMALFTAMSGCAGLEAESAKPAAGKQKLCVWLLWVQGRVLVGEVEQALADGEHLLVVGRRLNARNPERALLHSQCTEGAKLEPVVLEAAGGLKLGEVSPGFPLRDGTGFVLRSTEEYRKRGQELFKQRLYRKAEGLLRRDLELNPTRASSWLLLGRSRAALGDVNDAVAAFAKAAEYDPANPAHLFYKGLAHEELGQDEAALEAFSEALSLNPENPVLAANLARALADNGRNLDEAEALARKVLDLEPENYEAWVALAKAQRARGMHAQAAASFHKALSLRPQDPVTRQDFLDAMLAVDSGMMHKLEPGRQPQPAQAPGQEPPPLLPRMEGAAQDQTGRPGPPAAAGEEEPKPLKVRAPARAPLPHKPMTPTPVPPAAPVKAKEPPPAEGRHFIQVGSFPDEARARAEVAKWSARGMAGRLERFQLPGGPPELLVLLGPYPTRDKARSEGQRLKETKAIEFFMVVEREPAPAEKR